MRELSQKQSDIYKALFNPRESHNYRNIPDSLIEESKAVFRHDIFEHFLIPDKFYNGKNICYYLHNIVLYAAYMGAIANSPWPPEDFCNRLANLGLNCIKLFFRNAQAELTEDFCEFLKQTIIESFKNQIENKERLNKIIERQFRYLAYKVSIKTTDSATAYKEDKASGKLGSTGPGTHCLSGAWDMLTAGSEQAFAADLLTRCGRMLSIYGFSLSTESTNNVNTIQNLQHKAVNNVSRGYSSYDARIGFLVVITLLWYIAAVGNILTGDPDAPYSLMGSFLFTLFTYFYYNSNEVPCLEAERKRYAQARANFEEELHDSVKIESTQYDYKIKSPYSGGTLSELAPPLPVRKFIFAKLPESVAESAPEDEKRHDVTKRKGKGTSTPATTLFFPKEKSEAVKSLSITDLQDVPDTMALRLIDNNLYLIYDPNKSYGGDWIKPELEKARASRASADTGFVSLGSLKVTNRPDTVRVYELKNLHRGKGQATDRLLIPLVQLNKKDGSKVGVLDCRGALFVEGGLHTRGLEDFRFNPAKNKICSRENAAVPTQREAPEPRKRMAGGRR